MRIPDFTSNGQQNMLRSLHERDVETPGNTCAINLLSVVSRCLGSGVSSLILVQSLSFLQTVLEVL